VRYREKISAALSRKEFFDGLIFRILVRRSSAPDRKNLAVFSKDPVGLAIASMGIFEGDILRFLFNYLDAQGLITGAALDVGANVGNHSVFFARFYDSVESFEPHPVTFQLLSVNARLDNRIFAHNCGASDVEGVLDIYNEPHSFGGASLHPHRPDPGLQRYQVPVRPLDAMPHLFQRKIGLIKVDVEGHELNVLRGAAGLIAKNKPAILFEQHIGDFDSTGRSAVIEYLRGLSYEKFALVRRGSEVGGGTKSSAVRICKLLKRLCLGYSMSVELVSEVPPAFYPSILALP
jgi:FkbM family methyltransferase